MTSETTSDERSAGTVSLRPANPDGKAASGLLRDWYASAPRGVVAKPQRQVLAELFTSLLVLSAKFGHKPSVGVANYLYCREDCWVLSLIAPDEWADDRHDTFAGVCVLQPDRTWTIVPSDALHENTPVAQAVRRFHEAFVSTLDNDGLLEDILPFHAKDLGYHQRLNANALSRSIRAAITLGDQRRIPLRDWRLELPEPGDIPLPGNG